MHRHMSRFTFALALLAVEWWLRREAAAARSESAPMDAEARVA